MRLASAAVVRIAAGGERRGTLLVLVGIAAIWAGALALAAAGHSGAAAGQGHVHGHVHGALDAGGPGLLALAVMWGAMMVAMMVPAEASALAGLVRPRSGAAPASRAAGFFAGLLATWTAFAALAAAAHWALEQRGLLGADGVLASPAAAALLVGAIGAFQLTPAKRRCLERCRARLEASGARGEPRAALAAGLRHGTISLGSCALLMLVPLGLGGMRLAPMVALTALLVVEKLGRPVLVAGRLAGLALLGWSAAVLVGVGGG